jgi:hypothetical protein
MQQAGLGRQRTVSTEHTGRQSRRSAMWRSGFSSGTVYTCR